MFWRALITVLLNVELLILKSYEFDNDEHFNKLPDLSSKICPEFAVDFSLAQNYDAVTTVEASGTTTACQSAILVADDVTVFLENISGNANMMKGLSKVASLSLSVQAYEKSF